jgi:hypothetical protein
VVPGGEYRPPLPASGTALSFNLPLGPTPLDGWQAELLIEVEDRQTEYRAPTVAVNGIAGELRGNDATRNGNRLLTYSIPLSALPGRNQDTITVSATGQHSIKVFRVEVRLHPGE